MPYLCKKYLIETKIDEDLIFLDRDSGFYYGLNSVGHRIWQLLNIGLSQEMIISTLLQEYKVNEQTCEREVTNFICALKENALIKENAI